ncbi:MAG TPA: carbon starvation CstA family protein [Pirellulales bacterium]|nr:carbon starvation CstA family protein [Pirellulales bacterium]
MTLLAIVVISAVVLSLAYFTYGTLLTRLLELDPQAETPAVTLRDDVDYAPIEPKFLLSQHFSAIAAAGPIVGPIVAGVAFGWLPAWLWILFGSTLIGGVHDFTTLVASIRHNARSIAEVVRDQMSGRAYLLFLAFVWLSLVYIIVAFTDVTASAFIGTLELDDGQKIEILGGGVATSSLLYLALPIIMGLLLRYTRLSITWATVIFLPLVGVAIWAGQKIPLDVEQLFHLDPYQAKRVWNVALLAYCFVASVIPMWLLLQPRGHLGGYFLYLALGGGMLGVLFGGGQVEYPEFTGWVSPKGDALFPMLFVLIACGACSGFHSVIASGTTSKQLRRETDAKLIGYGAMLLEAMVAVVSLCCVMKLSIGHKLIGKDPNYLYAVGVGDFLRVIGIPVAFGISFGLMAFTTFVYDTLDVCTRLGRYILEELTGRHDRVGRWGATAVTAAVPLFFLLQPPTLDASGNPLPAWKVFWSLFGASNQLLAALTLLGVTVWLWQTRRVWWVWLVTGIPAGLMYTMSTWALVSIIQKKFAEGVTLDPVPWVAVVLIGLAALMLAEAAWVIAGPRRERGDLRLEEGLRPEG